MRTKIIVFIDRFFIISSDKMCSWKFLSKAFRLPVLFTDYYLALCDIVSINSGTHCNSMYKWWCINDASLSMQL